MRKTSLLLAMAVCLSSLTFAREISGNEAQQLINGAEKIITGTRSDVPEYVQFNAATQPQFGDFSAWAHQSFHLPADHDFILLNADKDNLGYTHYRYRETYRGLPVEASMYIVHVRNNKIVSMNGEIFGNIQTPTSASINESDALAKALVHMNASLYRWQEPVWEQQIKRQTNNPSASWFPKGELMLAPQNGKVLASQYKLAWRFDVYAEKPLKREYVYVDANTGEIIFTQNRIESSNSLATANTAYSGPREITTDSVDATTYRLREANRGAGQGIETYDLQQTTNYANNDFFDTDNFWNNINAALDQYATDAHWGAEKTYDYYETNFNRNSIDNAGMLLYSYVHYDVNFVNAFWDGTEMTYGDGDGTYTPLTSLEIAGHEISHGVTERTSGLIYQDEPGAMNEGFSDCMGNSIRWFGKGVGNIDWGIGNEIGGTPFRDMSNPNLYQNPDCYNGLYWNAPNEVHNNSGVLNFWYYLLTEGGTGTNDIGNAYNVTGIGIQKAEQICYRMNAVYLFPAATYADARQWAIQAAIDLYGPCSPEHQATTNAWYAVGVGGVFAPGVTAGFTASANSFCSVPASVNFTNTTSNANIFHWYFGDGVTSTSVNPNHVYTTGGQYTVTLYADGGVCGNDSLIITAMINVNLPASPAANGVTACQGQTATLNATGAGTIAWYSTAIGNTLLDTGATYVTPPLSTSTTYYVASTFPSPAQFNTPFTNAGSGTYYTNVTYRGEIFDVLSPCTLVSVLVYSQAATTKTIVLNQGGTTIQSATVNVPNGMSRVTLNFPLPVGNALELGTDDGTDLFRNDGSAVYPFTLAGLVTITDNTAGASGYYYFFYDWEIQGPSCASARIPVLATVSSPVPAFTTSVFANIVSFTDNSTGAITNYSWDFNDTASGVNNTSSLQNPVHVFTDVGQYTVCLTVSDGMGCSSTVCQSVNITQVGVSELNASAGISVFPNPVTDVMVINFGKNAPYKKWTLMLTDLLGRNIEMKTADQVQSLEWNLSDLAPGSYILSLQSDNEKIVKAIVRQ